MPRVAKELSALEVKRLKHPTGEGNPVAFAVGGVAGLNLQITASGARSWVLRTTVASKRRELGLGSYPEVGVADARDAARDHKSKIRQGVDPIEERKSARAELAVQQRKGLTYREAVKGYFAIYVSKNPKTKQSLNNMVVMYSDQMLGHQRVGDITRDQVASVLRPIWDSKTSTATRLREHMKRVFDWAKGNGHMDGDNPAEWKGCLEYVLPKPDLAKTHQPTVALKDAPRWMAELRKREGNGSRALELLVLTASRSSEVRGARWDEIDLERGVWIIPGHRMKVGSEHRVALSLEAQALLSKMPRESDLVFPALRGGELSDMTLSAAMKRIHADDEQGFVDPTSGKPAVPHGWRSAFRSWTAEHGYDRDMSEMALAHKVGSDVERAYQRSDMLERRRALMQDWANFLEGHPRPTNIVELRRG